MSGTGTGRPPTLLVRRGHHGHVCALLQSELGGAVEESTDDPAVVRLSWSDPGLRPADALALASEALADRYDDVSRLVVANAVVSRGVAPDAGDDDDVTGQPKTFGNGSGAPVPARALAARTGAAYASPVTVGVLDTRLVPHDWLVGSYLADPGTVERHAERLALAGSAGSDVGHSTFIAGLVLQQAPSATLRAAHVLDADGTCELYELVQAVRRVARAGVDVLNLSLGCHTDGDVLPWPLLDALEELPQGSVVVAAAGNHDPRSPVTQRPFWPAALPHVIAVGALAPDDTRAAAFSNDGSWVDLWATGDDLVSTFVSGGEFDGWASWGGTSFAAAVVSGVVAARTSREARVSAREAAYELLDELASHDVRVPQARGGGGTEVVLTRTADRSAAPVAAP